MTGELCYEEALTKRFLDNKTIDASIEFRLHDIDTDKIIVDNRLHRATRRQIFKIIRSLALKSSFLFLCEEPILNYDDITGDSSQTQILRVTYIGGTKLIITKKLSL